MNTLLSNNELTALLNEESAARAKAKTIANITRRALTLWADGYTFTATGSTSSFRHYAVTSPKGDVYAVCLSDTPTDELFGDYCSCPAWKKFGECKHHLAVLEAVREEEQIAHWEEVEEQDDRYALRSDCNAYGY